MRKLKRILKLILKNQGYEIQRLDPQQVEFLERGQALRSREQIKETAEALRKKYELLAPKVLRPRPCCLVNPLSQHTIL